MKEAQKKLQGKQQDYNKAEYIVKGATQGTIHYKKLLMQKEHNVRCKGNIDNRYE